MNHKILIISILSVIILFGCQNESSKQENVIKSEQFEKVMINPLDELKQVDNLLSELAEKPQSLTTPSDRETAITGAKGTIIHVDPKRLETVDSSQLGDNIEIELLEMTDNSSILLNNAQTVSNGQILITGGAYYLNMTSDGKQLKMKQGKGLLVEFPKLTEDEMGLFLGERDRLGQINWVSTNEKFETKNIPDAKKPEKPIKINEVVDSIFFDGEPLDPLVAPKKVNKEEVSEEEYQENLKQLQEYEEQKKENEYKRQTYQAVKMMNFGWINCDRFFNDPSPKTDIQLILKNDSLQGARFFAVFKDIRSVMTEYYYKGRKENISFRNIPDGKELTIIALSAKNETPYFFETTINTANDKQVYIEFMETTQVEIKEKMKIMN